MNPLRTSNPGDASNTVASTRRKGLADVLSTEAGARLQARADALQADNERLRRALNESEGRHTEMAEAITHLLKRGTQQLQRGFDMIGQTTERGVLQSGDCIQTIVTMAAEQMRTAQQVQARIHDNHSLRKAANAQTEAIRRFTGDIRQCFGDQPASAATALHNSKRMSATAAEVSEIALSSRILSINAQIEAARLGELGTPVSVIAAETSKLNKRIEDANTRISELAAALTKSLPEFLQATQRFETLTDEFSSELGHCLDTVMDAETELRDSIDDAAEVAGAGITLILTTANDALSALQFQDPLQQKLLKLTAANVAIHCQVAEVLGTRALESLGGMEAIPDGDPLVDEEHDLGHGELLMF